MPILQFRSAARLLPSAQAAAVAARTHFRNGSTPPVENLPWNGYFSSCCVLRGQRNEGCANCIQTEIWFSFDYCRNSSGDLIDIHLCNRESASSTCFAAS